MLTNLILSPKFNRLLLTFYHSLFSPKKKSEFSPEVTETQREKREEETMSASMSRAEELEKKALRRMNSLNIFGSKYEDAAELFSQSANQFKLAKSWERAGSAFVKLSNCHLKLDSQHEAATAYADAAKCYKKTSSKGAISCLERAMDIFLDLGRYSQAAKYCKEIGELYEQDQDHEKAIMYFERAADYFETQDATSLANQCKLKVAELSAQLEQYQKAIAIYEEIARYSLGVNLLKYGVRGHLLNAGLCQLCRGDVVAITNALERYEDLDPTFSRTREYKFLSDLAAAYDEEDVPKFTAIVKEFDSFIKLDSWKVTVLLRVKNDLKAKELEDDLT
ncbi:hypothetical protein Tsubulata_031086 [Turnera subulata]|uniref:NSF attachment protein n=1 Tax=Turnera subulata TaxID=218843 RepID=A0A9Q0G109_9ROSI|nr:hypothetical protein Tsubulata_031086 [Turnera subulata]